MEWYELNNASDIDTPALVIYPDRVRANIQRAIEMVGDVNCFRPHVKTHKMAEVTRMLLDAGVTRFKSATIAESEMLAMEGAPDVLLAYQPVGPKAKRLLQLGEKYPNTQFSCVVDDAGAARALGTIFKDAGREIPVYIDCNNGMNRSGIRPENAVPLAAILLQTEGIRLVGIHVYDGHLRDTDLAVRQQKSDRDFAAIEQLQQELEQLAARPMTIVAGGSPSFPTHLQRTVECSPGTFVFWDWGYKHILPDEPFEYAAILLTRVISIVNQTTMTTDLGHKSVAAENPFPRVHFLNAPDAKPVGQSEEHLVLEVPDSSQYAVGDLLYGVPVHICPTVALYDRVGVAENHRVTRSWRVVARDRAITI